MPVLVTDTGKVICESRTICEQLLAEPGASALMPSPFEGPIWAYHDFVDGPLEDVLFRISTPAVRDAWATPFERALYVLIKERKFGAGCVDAWLKERPALIAKARHLLAPTFSTLEKTPFLFGQTPTRADARRAGSSRLPATTPRQSRPMSTTTPANSSRSTRPIRPATTRA